jgi:transmembrane sensor
MPEKYMDIDALIAKVLADEANVEEQQTLHAWLHATPDNQQYFETLQRLWQQVPQAQVQAEVDTEKALQKVKSQVQKRPAQRLSIGQWWLRAAAICIAVVAAIWFWPRSQPDMPLALVSTDATLSDTLPDGSLVVLNRHSSLRFVGDLNQEERRARLSGEAFFQVVKNEKQPFVVEAGPLEITVIGTEFNVDYQVDAGRIVVAVSTGKVRLRSPQQTELIMAGEQVEYNLSDGQIKRVSRPNVNVLAYKNRQFTFNGTPLHEVIAQLSEVYGISITLKNNNLALCPLQANFNQMKLEQVLDVIAESFSLSIERTPQGVVLDGEGCE